VIQASMGPCLLRDVVFAPVLKSTALEDKADCTEESAKAFLVPSVRYDP